MFLARARVNSLKLEEAVGRGNEFYNRTCKLCNQEEEDLVHFLMKCPALERQRNDRLLNKDLQDPKERMIEFLFKKEKFKEKARMIRMMWYTRRNILEYIKKTNVGERSTDGNEEIVMSDPGPERRLRTLETRRTRSSSVPGSGSLGVD